MSVRTHFRLREEVMQAVDETSTTPEQASVEEAPQEQPESLEPHDEETPLADESEDITPPVVREGEEDKPPLLFVEENYSFSLTVMENSQYNQYEPTGRIELRIPYDGLWGFTHRMYDAVTRRASDNLDPVSVGYLSISEPPPALDAPSHDWRKTRINIELPVTHDSPTSAPRRIERLIADRYRCVLSDEYQPPKPRLHPLEVSIAIYDELASGSIENYLDSRLHVNHQYHGLQLQFTCGVTLPAEQAETYAPGVILKSLSLNWPVVPDRDKLSIEVRNAAAQWEAGEWLYNPSKQAIEVYNVPMRGRRTDTDVSWIPYLADLRFGISMPGDLYEVSTLTGEIEVEIDGLLLSGRQFALIYHRDDEPSIERVRYITRIKGDLTIFVDSSFRRRSIATYWKMLFDGIELESARADDLIAALNDQGYEITRQRWQEERDERGISRLRRYWIECARWEEAEGGYSHLQILLERGPARSIDWEEEIPGGGKDRSGGRLRTNIPDEQIVVHIRGRTRGSSSTLTHGIRMLQHRLKHVFYSLAVGR
jgi:hypothetical protein